MSADAVGVRLRAEVQEESLSELLSEIRHIAETPARDLLGVQPIDRLLDVLRFPPSATDLHPSHWLSTDPTNNDDNVYVRSHTAGNAALLSSTLPGPKSKPAIVEITGTQPSCGKTNLLYYLSAKLTLPTHYGGKNKAIVWIDTDGRLSSLRLQVIMSDILSKHDRQLNHREKTNIVREALCHIHVFRPQNSSQTIATMQSLSNYLLNTRSHASGSRTLGAIILDSATTFYWQDRLDTEIARLEAAGTTSADHNQPNTSANKTSASPSKTAQILTLLKQSQQQFDCAILYTTTTTTQLSPSHQTNPATNLLSHPHPAPPPPTTSYTPWTHSATLTVSLSRLPVPQFAPHMSLEMCQRDRQNRAVAVAKGRFVVTPSSSNGEEVGGDAGGGRFEIRITGWGVEVVVDGEGK